MGGKQSTPPRGRTYSSAGQGGPVSPANGAGLSVGGPGTSGSNYNARARARSLGSVQGGGAHGPQLTIPTSNGATTQGAGSPDSDASTPEEGPFSRAGFLHASSLPVHLFSFHGKFITYVDLCKILNKCHTQT
jgi:hypothetical protein